jgi:hypothetical protein
MQWLVKESEGFLPKSTSWGLRYRQALDMERRAEQALLGPTNTDDTHWSKRRRGPTGAFYTPYHLVRFLVRYTLQPVLIDIYRRARRVAQQESRAHLCLLHQEAAHLQVLDPACGCGRFLLVAFRSLRCLHLRLALHMARLEGSEVSLSALEALANRRALNCLRGIDIHEQAVAATRAVLLHAAGEVSEACPHLQVADVTLAGDVIPTDVDVCIGNPPWGAVGARRAARALGMPATNANTFGFFLIRCLDSLAPGGRLGFVLPRNFCKGNDYELLRRELLTRTCVEWIGDAGRAFPGVTQEAVVVVARRQQVGERPGKVRIASVAESQERVLRALDQMTVRKTPRSVIPLTADQRVLEVLDDMDRAAGAWRLRNWVAWGRGLEYGQDGALVRCPECGAYNSLPKKKRSAKPCSLCGAEVATQAVHYRLVSRTRDSTHTAAVYVGRHVRRYRLEAPYWLDPAVRGVSYKTSALFEQPKILLPKISPSLAAAVDISDAFVTQGVYILRPRLAPWSLFSLAGLINSSALSFYYEYRFNDGAVLTTNVTLANLLALPVPDTATCPEALVTLEGGARLLSHETDEEADLAVNRAVTRLFGLSTAQRTLIRDWWQSNAAEGATLSG